MLDTTTEGNPSVEEVALTFESVANDISSLVPPPVGVHHEVTHAVARHRLLDLIDKNQMSPGVALDLLGILSEIPVQDLFSLEPSTSDAIDGFIYHSTLQAPLEDATVPLESTPTEESSQPVTHFGVFAALVPEMLKSSTESDLASDSPEQRSKGEQRLVGLVERILLNNDAQFRSAVLTTAEILGANSASAPTSPEGALDQELRFRIQVQRVIDRVDSKDGKWTPLTAQLERERVTR